MAPKRTGMINFERLRSGSIPRHGLCKELPEEFFEADLEGFAGEGALQLNHLKSHRASIRHHDLSLAG